VPVLVLVAEDGQVSFDGHPGSVPGHQDHRLLPVRVRGRVGLAHHDEDLAPRVGGPADPPLAAVDHVVVTVPGYPGRNVRGIRGRHIRFGHRDKEKEWAFGYPGEFNGAHLKADYEGLEFETVSGDTEFLPGVTLIEAPGHTPGTMAMKVDLPETGTMIFTSDAVYMGDSYGPPATPAAIVNDLSAWYGSVEKLRGIAEKSDATVIFGHDVDQLRSLRRAPDGFYA
jgi:glyoxylase-like metal-dependent hydrolase (beta-lactamase superfamily II)